MGVDNEGGCGLSLRAAFLLGVAFGAVLALGVALAFRVSWASPGGAGAVSAIAAALAVAVSVLVLGLSLLPRRAPLTEVKSLEVRGPTNMDMVLVVTVSEDSATDHVPPRHPHFSWATTTQGDHLLGQGSARSA